MIKIVLQIMCPFLFKLFYLNEIVDVKNSDWWWDDGGVGI